MTLHMDLVRLASRQASELLVGNSKQAKREIVKHYEKMKGSIMEYVAPLYSVKDIMHDFSHITRIKKKAIEYSKGIECDIHALELAVLLHGIVYTHENEIRDRLSEVGTADDEIESIIHISWDSQKDSSPDSKEGMLIHDAHLLEGDENFIITKSLITGSLRGQTLEQTIDYYFKNIHSQFCCCFSQNQVEYEKREQLALEYFEKLRVAI
jgi:uncharacterized protein